jgi:hypothetical protein
VVVPAVAQAVAQAAEPMAEAEGVEGAEARVPPATPVEMEPVVQCSPVAHW